MDVRDVGQRLGVRYVLEGSVRRALGQLRVTGQLVEAETGNHVWAERYDGVMTDVFELQDRITAAVAGVLEPSIRRAEIESRCAQAYFGPHRLRSLSPRPAWVLCLVQGWL